MSQTVTLDEIYTPIEKELNAVSGMIYELLSSRNELTEEVVRYFFSAKGKLLRPALTFLGGYIKGEAAADSNALVRLGAAYEIFHSATLIHDDIIDAADIRRNLETVHLKWSPQVAVLVGDFLHDQAIKTVFETDNKKVIHLFLETAGQVCDGEIHELNVRKKFDLSEKEYMEIIDKKTASLLACALAGGSLMSGANDAEKEALYRFGMNFGAAFQIIDDCLDLTGNEGEFGKTLGKDFEEGVLTLPFIHYFHHSDAAKKDNLVKAFEENFDEARLAELIASLKAEGSLQYALDRAKELSDNARKELSIFPENPARKSLERLLDYILERNK